MDDTEVGQIASWVGLDVGEEDHHATVISAEGERLFELVVSDDEAQIERLLDLALESGRCALGIDQPGSVGSLAVCVPRRRDVPVAYMPGLVMRRASELYPGEAKTLRVDPDPAAQAWSVTPTHTEHRTEPGRDARAATCAGRLRRRPRPRREQSGEPAARRSTMPPSPASPAAAATSSTRRSAPAPATANYQGRQDRPPNPRSHSPPKYPLTNP
jgi:hypothetical protein